MQSSRRTFPWIALALLLVYFGLRLHRLLALPLFIDEMLHAEMSADVWHGHPLWFGVHGRYLSIWWLAAFWPFQAVPWLVRASTLLLTLPGAAAVFVLGRRVTASRRGVGANPGTGTLALLLAAFTPMLFFFDRMGLADTTLHAVLSLFTLSLFWLYDRNTFRPRWALLAGACYALAVLAKASALTAAPLVIVAALLLPHGWPPGDRVKSALGVFGTALALWLPLLLLMQRSNVNYLSIAGILSTEESSISFVEKALINSRFVLEGLWTFFGALPLLAAGLPILAAIAAYPRRAITVAAAAFGPAAALVIFGSQDVATRYWVIMIPPALVLVAVGLLRLGAWFSDSARILRRKIGTEITLPDRGYISPTALLPALLVIPWLLWAVFPFIGTAYDDPTALRLPSKDREEYITADSAGVMLPEVAAFLAAERDRLGAPLNVSGAIATCYGLRLYAQDNTLTIDCPNVLSGERRGAWLDNHMAELAAVYDPLYAVFEQPGLALARDIQGVTLEPLADFPRPVGPYGEAVTLTVYRVLLAE